MRPGRLSAALLALSICMMSNPALAQAPQVAVSARISPPQSGVRLLEELFQRVRSAPQVAMAKNLKQQQEAQSSIALKDGPTDYSLAIRPKQAGKVALVPQPTLPLVNEGRQIAIASSPTNMYKGNFGLPAGPAGGGGGGANGGAAYAPMDSLRAQDQAEVASAPAMPTVESWYGNRQLSTVPTSSGIAAGTIVSTRQEPTRPGLWENSIAWSDKQRPQSQFHNSRRDINIVDERPIVHDFRDASGGLSLNNPMGGMMARTKPGYVARSSASDGYTQNKLQAAPAAPPQAQPPDLASATSRLYNLSKTLQAVQSGAAVRSDADALMQAAPQKRAAAEATSYSSDWQSSSAAGAKAKLAGSLYKKESLKAEMKEAKDAKADSGALDDEESDRRALERESALRSRKKTQVAWAGRDGIAALPPNVVTGIPMVRLGISENQANSALHTVGTTKQDRVDKWTVLSWQRSMNRNFTALQLYVRNGQLDAMRIFDPSLIAGDFGVSLGDDLSRVKEKFGEPAFILPEPGGNGGQNYIYPISQVGFQLARPAPGQQPRVASVLIFNVK